MDLIQEQSQRQKLILDSHLVVVIIDSTPVDTSSPRKSVQSQHGFDKFP